MGKLTTKLKPYFPGKRNGIILGGILLVSFILFGLAAHQARYNIGSDAISYISIAEHYARGDFKTAVNGYWSPAVSWIMAPLIKFGIDGRLAFAIINGLSAAVVLLAGAILVWWRTCNNLLATSLFIVTMAIFLRSVIGSFFPDILVIAWVAVFMLSLLIADQLAHKGNFKVDLAAGMTLGLLGAIGYAVKLYILPFFVATIALWALIRVIAYRNRFQQILSKPSIVFFLRLPVIVAATLCLFMAPWVAALTYKYGYVTVGSSFAVNTAPKFREIPRSNNQGQAESVPKRELSIAVPPYETAVTTTQDRTPSLGGRNLPKVDGSRGLSNYIEGRKQGIPPYLSNLTNMWPMLFIVVGFSLVVVLKWRVDYRANNHILLTLAAFTIYFAGYAALAGPTGGNIRYHWPLFFLGALLLSFLIFHLWKLARHHALSKTGVLLISVLSAVVTYGVYSFSVGDIVRQPQISRLEEAATSFREDVPIRPYDNYLSNNGRQNRTFAYYVGGQAYGSLSAGHDVSDPDHRVEMKEKNINYFLHFAPGDEPRPQLLENDQILGTYFLGDNFSRCQDTRVPSFDSCTLYIVRLQHR